ncbi:MAG: CPBP family intramembrane metalloprotease [Lachnospiraceae bacterium]|nr:CPBP family intramembrane metalloprotease [Lachnospiraceae bacterium]
MKKVIKSAGVCLLFILMYFGIQFLVSTVINAVSGYKVSAALVAEGVDVTSEEFMTLYYERANEFVAKNLGIVSFVSSLLSCAVIFLIALGSKKKEARNEGRSLSAKEALGGAAKELGIRKISAVKTVLSILAGFGLIAVINGVLSVLPLPEWLISSYSSASSVITGSSLIGQIIGVVIAPALAEEILFRGVILGRLKRVMPVWSAVIVSSLAFALVHGNPLWIAYTFVMGLLVAMIDVKYDSIVPGMIMHFMFNLYGCLAATLMLPLIVYIGYILIGAGIFVMLLSGGISRNKERAALC